MNLADKMIDQNKNDAWGYFYLGGAYGFRGTFHNDFGSFFKAFTDGYKGFKKMKKCLELNENFYDAYYGTGLFHFWRAFYAQKYKFRWLSSGEEEMNQGIREIKKAIDKGKYVSVEANSSFVRILYVLERYQEALELAEEITKDYPNYLYCYWYIASCYGALGKKEEQLKTYYWLKNYFEKAPLSGLVALVEIYYNIGKTLQELGKYQEAMQYTEMAATHESKIDERVPLQRKYKKLIKKLRNKLKKEINGKEKK